MRSILAVCLSSFLFACSGGPGSTNDAGPTSDAANSQDGGGTCTATATIIAPSFTQFFSSLSVVGNDVYWIDSSLGLNAPLTYGAIQHATIDGSSAISTIVTPTAVVYGATAIGSDLFYFQEDDSDQSAIHLYRSPRATGGVGTQLGTDTYPGIGSNIINACQTCGVFAAQGTDIFVSDGTDVSRVSTTTGIKTIVSTSPEPGNVVWPALVGSTIYYKDLTGGLYSASASATTASATLVGSATCGTGRYQWMGVSSAGFVCGESFGIDAIDITGTTKTHVIYTLMDADPTSFNPTSVDGTTYYALPRDGQVSHPMYKLDTSSTNKTPVACDVRQVVDYKMTSTDIVWIEGQQDLGASNATYSLRRIAR